MVSSPPLTSFDNIPESALCAPPLTTVEQPIRKMGERSIELPLALIRGEQPEATHITLETNLVIRQSTRARRPASEVKGSM